MRKVVPVAVAVVLAGAAALWWWAGRKQPWTDAATPPPPVRRALDAFGRGDLDGGLNGVREFLNHWSAPAWDPPVRIAAAVHLDRAGRPDAIPQVLPRALASSEPLAAHAELLRARSALARGRARDADAAASRAAATPGFPGRDEALRLRASSLEALGRGREALAALDAGADPSLRLEAARLAIRVGDRTDGRRRLAELVLDPGCGETSERALADLVALVPEPRSRFTDAERARVADAALRWVEIHPARAFDLTQALHPDPAPLAARSPSEALVESEALRRLGRLGEAERLLLRAAQGDAETRAGARYLAARLDLARGRRSRYRAGLDLLARSPGDTRGKRQALLDLAEIADGRPTADALSAYRRYREAVGSRDPDPVALFREGWIAYELGRWPEARAAMARVLDRPALPVGVRAAALYWSARLADRDRDARRARRLDEEIVSRCGSHYYAGLAERRLRRPPPSPPESRPAAIVAARAGDGAPWLLAARALMSVGLWDLASASYRAAARLAPEPHAHAIALEAAQGALDAAAGSDAVQILESILGDREGADPSALPRPFWRALYPAPDADQLVRASLAARFDPRFVASIVMEESGFNPLAVSPVGARGLLQLMPATGFELARRLGIAGFTADALFDPAVNLRLGTAYLGTLRSRTRSIPMMLAAYNAGPARAERWALTTDGPDGEAFVERIPIPATRIYVKRILANERMYRIAWPEGFISAADAGRPPAPAGAAPPP